MIRTSLRIALVWLVSAFASEAGTIVQNISDISYWVGSGENRAVLIIDWEDGKNVSGEIAGEALAWGYQWPASEMRTGKEMLEAIAAADPRLEVYIQTRSFGPIVFGMAHDLDGDGGTFTFDPFEEAGGASDPNDHFAEGWEQNGFWGYKVGTTTSQQRPSWRDASEGFATRALTNNSWDAWVFSSDLDDFSIASPSPALAVIPEPSCAALLVGGGLLLLRRRARA